MLLTTNKKNGEQFIVGRVNEEGKQILISMDGQLEKVLAQSTFKKAYTKPVEIEDKKEDINENEQELESNETKNEDTDNVQKESLPYIVDDANDLTSDNTPQQMKNYLQDCLSCTELGDIPNEFVECKDGSVAIRYKGKTITQIKGKKKIRVFFNSKHLQLSTAKKMFVENEKYTHDSYVKLETLSDLEVVFDAIQEVKQVISQSK